MNGKILLEWMRTRGTPISGHGHVFIRFFISSEAFFSEIHPAQRPMSLRSNSPKGNHALVEKFQVFFGDHTMAVVSMNWGMGPTGISLELIGTIDLGSIMFNIND